MAGRKTTTSSEVKTRWIKANYRRYAISLRYDIDGDLISYLDAHTDGKKGTINIVRQALRNYIGAEEA